MMGGHWRMLRTGELDKDVKLSKGLFKRIVQFAKPYRVGLFVLAIAIALTSFLEVFVPPRLTIKIFDEAIGAGNRRHLAALSVIYICVSLGAALVQVISRWISSRIGEGLIFDLRVALFDHVQRMPIAFFTRTQTGALISRLNSDVVGAQRAVTETTAGILGIVLNITFALVGMFLIDPLLAVIAIGLAPIFLAPTRRMGRILQRLIKRQMENNAAMSAQMTERFQVGGALLVKLFGRPRKELDHFSEKAANVRDLGVKTAVYGRVFFVAFGLVASIGAGLVYWFGGNKVIGGALEVGELVGFTQLLMRLYAPITMLSNVRVEVMTAMVAFDRVFEVLDFPIGIADKPESIELVSPRGRVEFDSVRFRYPKGSEISIESLELPGAERRDLETALVLDDVSFVIEPGEMFALVGPSGAGKSTLTSLIPRLYEATEGAVRIDGHDVKDLTLDSLRASIGVVTQDAHMFHDTIRSNLLYAKPDSSEDELVDALRAAQIWDLVSTLPDGLETMVGERGYRLSGGEKQRLAIARLLLKDPAIMILDEATAHLDSESELAIQKALAEALSGRSSVVIAHRLSTVINATQILVLDGGRVVERGPHFDLLANGGLYEVLYRTQFERSYAEKGAP